jgi:hypothetical protein
MRGVAWLGAVVVVIATVLAALLWATSAHAVPLPAASGSGPTPLDPAVQTPVRVADADESPRSAADGIPRPEHRDGALQPCAKFDDMLEGLLGLVRDQWAACQARDLAAVERLEGKAEVCVAALHRCHPDVGMQALTRLGTLSCPEGQPQPDGLWNVLHTLLHQSLERAWQQRRQPAGRDRCDALTGAVLAVATQDPARAVSLGSALLADRPYLGLPHEGPVLQLVERSALEAEFREPATRLLRTLWHNLQAQQARGSAQLETMALLYLDDANPVRRRAAAVHLFLHGDARARELVLTELERRDDRRLAHELSLAAGEQLRGRQAVLAVERLADLAGQATTDAAARIASHSPEALRHSYEQHLADGSRPALRAHWVTGGALLPTAEGIALCKMALDRDPDPVVQRQAMFALTAQGTEQQAERALRRILAVAEATGDGSLLTAAVFGMQNALGAGHTDLVLRTAQELRGHRLLDAQSREGLAELLAAVAR